MFLSTLFLISYWASYVPYKPSIFSFEANYFEMLFVLSACVLIMPFCLKDTQKALDLIWYLGLGAFLWAAVTIFTTVLLAPSPYYGKIIDLRALARGLIQFGNTPGIANLLTFFPIIFYASLIYPTRERSKGYWVGIALVMITTLVAAVLIEQRSFFVINFFVLPILVGIFLFAMNQRKLGSWVLSLLAIYPLLILVNDYASFLDREIKTDIFLDARFEMVVFWLYQLLANPFGSPLVGPPPLDMYPHFHNFFADIHRISGFWPLLSAILLVLYIFIRLIYLSYWNRQLGFYLLAIAVPIFLIMISSVVPEGERQPFLALLLIGALCERYLATSVRTSPTTLPDG
ncbi:hypothetical protein [Polynucleobacter sp. HIN7]|uniref:hypothetical protein n=1 Tax=Polynucleobacter sp. HIN7 TaxID=3047866 RepID=UPI002572D6CB|nr:hypothetical protein [Polynucleobacter sp. HIN7]